MTCRKALRRILVDERGATAIEYALICGIMGAALVAVAGTGGALSLLWDKLTAVVDALT